MVASEPSHHGRTYVRFGPVDGKGRRRVRSYLCPAADDGLVIDVEGNSLVDPLEATHEMRWRSDFDSTGHVVFRKVAEQKGDAPPMWFVLMDVAPAYGAGMVALSGFTTDHFPDGTIIDETEFVLLDVVSEEQVGAVVWSSSTGDVDQLYVDPRMRRRDVARQLTGAAGVVHQVHGWPGFVRATGRRTELGERFVRARTHVRYVPHTELSPSMDPTDGIG